MELAPPKRRRRPTAPSNATKEKKAVMRLPRAAKSGQSRTPDSKPPPQRAGAIFPASTTGPTPFAPGRRSKNSPKSAAPHMRAPVGRRPYPAHAGVNLRETPARPYLGALPRACGGEPTLEQRSSRGSPRCRASTAHTEVNRCRVTRDRSNQHWGVPSAPPKPPLSSCGGKNPLEPLRPRLYHRPYTDCSTSGRHSHDRKPTDA